MSVQLHQTLLTDVTPESSPLTFSELYGLTPPQQLAQALWAAVQTRIHDAYRDPFLGHNLLIAPNSPDY